MNCKNQIILERTDLTLKVFPSLEHKTSDSMKSVDLIPDPVPSTSCLY